VKRSRCNGAAAAHRTVRLLPPLAADLRKWRLQSGRPAAKALIFPSATGTVWSQPAYQSWRRRVFKRSLDGAGVEHARPYDLRHSYASLLLHEGRSVIYVARQLGHDARLTLSTYGHVMDEFRGCATARCDHRYRRRSHRPGE
jgi:integrase